MKEEFLHYLWKYRLYDAEKLVDIEGNKIIVINPGEYNRDSGPDFFNARLKISGTEWAGNVEIHVKASHFNSHGHNNDPAFDNVILHVVAESDRQVFNSKGKEIMTSALFFNPDLFDRYMALVNNPVAIACQHAVGTIDRFLVKAWLSALVVERLKEKSDQIMQIFMETGNDWDETFYRILSRYFGFRINTEPFELLASILPFRIIRKHADNRFQIEAMLFGTAGLLEEKLFREAVTDDYYTSLAREFRVLSAKYTLKPIHGWLWKFARLRPVNFPTVRISQLAAMLAVSGGLFSRVLEAGSAEQIKNLFNVTASEYWDDHFVFGKSSRAFKKSTGSQAIEILIINSVVPTFFAYGMSHGMNDLCEKGVSFLEEIAPETNTIINEWRKAGVEPASAFESQALLQLRNNYCRKRRCLECRIGSSLIGGGRTLRKDEELILEP